MRIRLLGGFGVSVGSRNIGEDAWRLSKAASVVKLLALAPGHRMHREQAMDALWPDLETRAAANNLRQALHIARGVFDPSAASLYLDLERGQLALCPGGQVWVDVEAFEETAAAARRSQDPGAYRTAIELYSGELLPEDRYEEWAEERRDELRQLHLALLVELAGLHEERHEHELAIEVLRKATAREPTLEEAHAALMRIHALLGRPERAIAQYERFRDTLSRELGTDPGDAIRRLRNEIAAGRVLPTPSVITSREEELPGVGNHNLPLPRTGFVGREREMLGVRRALAMTRLMTLTGAGGSGKTRLGLEVAGDLVGLYPDGVWLVELAPLAEAELVPDAVAEVLGVREQPNRPLAGTLVEALKAKRMLLILDNCEHLIYACARFVDTLLGSCQHLRILATSREPLRVEGEVVWRVSSMTVPDTDRLPSATELTRYDAVKLFLQRARLRLPDFDITSANGRVVAEVCTRLEGMPLAIELATARMSALAVGEVAQRLEDSLSLLIAGPRTAVPRQRTMRATLEWSHGLLSDSEQVLFRRLSVFAGGWTLEASEAVGSDGIEKGDVLDLLSGLVDKSLVVAEIAHDGTVRYHMLEPVRQYAREKLEESREAVAVRHRHATFFIVLAEESKLHLRGARQEVWLERLEVEHDNFRAALSGLLVQRPGEQGEDAVPGIRLAGALWRFWESYGHSGEGRQWLERGLAGSSVPSVVHAEALNGAGYLALLQGDYELGMTRLEESIALFKELEDEPGLANSLSNLGIALLLVGDQERVSALRVDAEALRRGLIDQRALIDILLFLGMVTLDESDYEQMETLLEEGLALSRDLGDVRSITACLAVLGMGFLKQGNYERAALLLEECLYLTARRIRHMLGTAYSMLGLAGVAALRGQPARAARLWGAAEALRGVLGQPLAPYDHSNYDYEGYLAAARLQLDEPDWKAAWLEGQTMTLEQAVEYALSEEITAPSVPEKLPVGTRPVALTHREEEVAVLVSRGLTNRRIASELSISEHTVANHVSKSMRKLGLDSRSQLTAWVVERRVPS